jgi:hypothetical protein
MPHLTKAASETTIGMLGHGKCVWYPERSQQVTGMVEMRSKSHAFEVKEQSRRTKIINLLSLLL